MGVGSAPRGHVGTQAAQGLSGRRRPPGSGRGAPHGCFGGAASRLPKYGGWVGDEGSLPAVGVSATAQGSPRTPGRGGSQAVTGDSDGSRFPALPRSHESRRRGLTRDSVTKELPAAGSPWGTCTVAASGTESPFQDPKPDPNPAAGSPAW